jgi:hypothetical protein
MDDEKSGPSAANAIIALVVMAVFFLMMAIAFMVVIALTLAVIVILRNKLKTLTVNTWDWLSGVAALFGAAWASAETDSALGSLCVGYVAGLLWFCAVNFRSVLVMHEIYERTESLVAVLDYDGRNAPRTLQIDGQAEPSARADAPPQALIAARPEHNSGLWSGQGWDTAVLDLEADEGNEYLVKGKRPRRR